MNSDQIKKIMKSHDITRKYFKGVYAIDTVPCLRRDSKGFYVVNNDYKSGAGEINKFQNLRSCVSIIYSLGIHWLVVSNMSHDEIPEIFDSFGREPFRKEILEKLSSYNDLRYSIKQLQSCYTSVCGVYCCLYALWICNKHSLDSFLAEFSDSLLTNDLKVIEIFNNSFSQQPDL